MSFYQSIKPIILEIFGLSKDAIHIHIGFFCLVAFLLFSRRKLSSFIVLVPGFVVSLLMEIHDLRDDYVYAGTLNVWASVHDLVNTNLIPIVLVLLVRIKTSQFQR